MANLQGRVLQVIWSKKCWIIYYSSFWHYQFSHLLFVELNIFFNSLLLLFSTFTTTLKVLWLLQHMLKMSTTILCACCQLRPLMLLMHASQLISDTKGSFTASTNLLVYPCDTLSTSCTSTERNLIGTSWVIKQANPTLHIFQSIYLYNFHSKIL